MYKKNIECIDKIISFLEKEEYSNLTDSVYSRWIVWLCFFTGTIISSDWDETLLFKLSDHRLKNLVERFLKKTRSNNVRISTENELLITLSGKNKTVETIIKAEEISKYLQEPTSFPNKYRFYETVNSTLENSVPFDKSSTFKSLETLLIIMNKCGILSSTVMYEYDKNFKIVQCKSKMVKFFLS